MASAAAAAAFRYTAASSSLLASKPKALPVLSARGTNLCLRAQKQVIIVCTNSSCRKKGGAATLKLFQDLSPEDQVEITTQNCLDECPMGPNCGIEGEFVKVVNRVKTQEDVAAVLRSIGVEPLTPKTP